MTGVNATPATKQLSNLNSTNFLDDEEKTQVIQDTTHAAESSVSNDEIKKASTLSSPVPGGTNDTSSDPEELTEFVQDLLDQMQSRFNLLGDSILGRIDQMGGRIDGLERSIGDLMNQAGMDLPSGQSNNGLPLSDDQSDTVNNNPGEVPSSNVEEEDAFK